MCLITVNCQFILLLFNFAWLQTALSLQLHTLVCHNFIMCQSMLVVYVIVVWKIGTEAQYYSLSSWHLGFEVSNNFNEKCIHKIVHMYT